MTLERAAQILSAHGHCGAAWCVAYNGVGPHAFGTTADPRLSMSLSAEDAIRLAEEYERME